MPATTPHPAAPARWRPTRRAAAALLAVIALAPSVVFLGAAVGRSLQPVAHEPARTLQAIVDLFGALPPAITFVLFVVLPPVALALAGWATVDALRRDRAARGDMAALAVAVGRALRHPTLVAGLVVVAGGLAVIAILLVHAIAG